MFLQKIQLQNFRNYPKNTFEFSPQTTLVVAPNASGKSNLFEAILFLATGKSEKAEKDIETIRFGQQMARIKGNGILQLDAKFDLEIVITSGSVNDVSTPFKQYKVSGVPRRRADFTGNLSAVSFAPSDLDIIVGPPSLRRNFLNDSLEAVDRQYRLSLANYIGALRQRNALLDLAKETGKRNSEQFEYWDEILVREGQYVQKKRKELIDYINASRNDIFPCVLTYDWSEISKERLEKYKEAEQGAGVTLVGPHRDDFYVEFAQPAKNVKQFGSRGQQRLVILQLKIIQMDFQEKQLSQRPVLLLDDIFSELDEGHIDLVLSQIGRQQTIITTTHEELVQSNLLKQMSVIKLKNEAV